MYDCWVCRHYPGKSLWGVVMLKESAFIPCPVSLYLQVLVMSLINIDLFTLHLPFLQDVLNKISI